jgi:hypothetical protein
MSRVDVHEGAGDTRNIRFNFSISIQGTIIIPDARSLEYVGDRSVFWVA